MVSRRVLPPSLSDGNLWGEGDGKGVETSERVRRGRASSYEKKTVHYIYIYRQYIHPHQLDPPTLLTVTAAELLRFLLLYSIHCSLV